MKKGFFGIGIYNFRIGINVGTLWRSAYNFGADFLFTIGDEPYKEQRSDKTKTGRNIPIFHFTDIEKMKACLPSQTPLIGIEQTKNSRPINEFFHPKRAIYILGSENIGLSQEVLAKCNAVIHIETVVCINVAIAGSIVLFDRQQKLLSQSRGFNDFIGRRQTIERNGRDLHTS